MIGEAFDRLLTYGTPIFLFVKSLLEKTAGHPETQETALKILTKIFPDGRTRADELVFYASLVSLSGPDATLENKQLFLRKHDKLLHPNLAGKNQAEIAELRHKEKMAKGLVFLMAEDKSACDATCKKEDTFRLANKVWYGIFMGINDLPNDTAKLRMMEKRILHFGKNNQEQMTLAEVVEKINPLWGKIDSVAEKLGDEIFSFNDWAKLDYQKRRDRIAERKRQRSTNRWNWLNPRLWFQQFMDLR